MSTSETQRGQGADAMRAIRVLPEAVVRSIRAGEVVERPASVAKELVENALDAGATQVRVRLWEGGRERMLVEDDGQGIPPAELALAVRRHATSKLDGDDLSAVATYGFRGEALASVAAVATLRLISRQRTGDCAWTVEAGPDGVTEPAPAARGFGTTVDVRDLFSGHPARAKFLRPARREAAAVRDVIEAAALARPDVVFHLECDDRSVLLLQSGDWEARARAVMGPGFAAHCLPFAATTVTGTIRGLIGLPGWKGHAAAGQRILVNGRPVRDRAVSSALKAAFATASRDTAPAAVLDLRLDPATVDANAHPAKAEVRMSDPAAVAALVREAVSQAVSGGSAAAVEALSIAAARAAVPLAPAETGDRRHLLLGRGLGVALGGYALCETTAGVVMVDLHAAAERATLEKLRSSALSHGVPSRPLPSPLPVQVGAAAADAFEARSEDMRRLGLVAHLLDDTTLSVHEIPAPVADAAAADLVREVAGVLARDPFADPLGRALEGILVLMACHASFRFGDDITPDRLDAMLRDFEATPNIATCPHGRPTVAVLGRARLEGIFGRR